MEPVEYDLGKVMYYIYSITSFWGLHIWLLPLHSRQYQTVHQDNIACLYYSISIELHEL